MESFSLPLPVTGWNLLKTALDLDGTFSGKYRVTDLFIRNTHAANTLIVKGNVGPAAAPSTDSGINLTASGGAFPTIRFQGNTQLDRIWIKSVGGAGTIDITFCKLQ